MWRSHGRHEGITSWEVVVSAQTSLLETEVAVDVWSDIAADSLLWSPGGDASRWRPIAAGAALPPVIVISPSTARRALGASFAAAALLGSPRRRATANEGDTESADTEEYFPLAAELAAEEALEMALEEALAASPPGGVHGRGGVSLSS